MKVAALQLGSMALGDAKLDYYWRICASKGVKILLLGEYVLNLFFKEIENLPSNMVAEQSERHLESIREFSKIYSTILIAPLVIFKKGKLYKSLVIASKGEVQFYHQQRLISFDHWNEARFFANSLPKSPKNPPVFEIDGIKIAPLFGYEAHFDEFWLKFKRLDVDLALIPSASTFDSLNRWREMLKTRAFLNSCYILRANRVGEYQMESSTWKFYGDTLWVKPNGEIEDSLGEKEELLLGELDQGYLEEIRRSWAFR